MDRIDQRNQKPNEEQDFDDPDDPPAADCRFRARAISCHET
jgi:hypothetical protein